MTSFLFPQSIHGQRSGLLCFKGFESLNSFRPKDGPKSVAEQGFCDGPGSWNNESWFLGQRIPVPGATNSGSWGNELRFPEYSNGSFCLSFAVQRLP